jgi:hypothetical protein
VSVDRGGERGDRKVCVIIRDQPREPSGKIADCGLSDRRWDEVNGRKVEMNDSIGKFLKRLGGNFWPDNGQTFCVLRQAV